MLSDNIQIVLVGVSEKLIQKLPNGIIGIPRTQSQLELAELYSGAELLVSLSHFETFGLTIVEALSCGTPVIVYDNTAQPELVSSDTGRVVPDGDTEKVVKTISELIITDFKRKHTINCRNRVLKYYDKNNTYQSYIQLYSNLCNDTY